jgi:hypothetical protein
VVLEDGETLKVTKSGSFHGEIANIRGNSSSSNNFMANSSQTGVLNNNIIVSKILVAIKIDLLIVKTSKFPPFKVTATRKSLETQRNSKALQNTVGIELGSASDSVPLYNERPPTAEPSCELAKRKTKVIPCKFFAIQRRHDPESRDTRLGF